MLNSTSDAKPGQRSSGWSNRILLAAIVAILFLTLYPFRFSPQAAVLNWAGVGLAQLLRRARPGELQLYDDVFYLMVFFPVGCLLGMIARQLRMRTLLGPFLVGLLVAPITLQVLLQRASGGLFSLLRDAAFSFLVAAGAALWMNTDHVSQRNGTTIESQLV